MRSIKLFAVALLAIAVFRPVYAEDAVETALVEELNRAMKELAGEELPPYFISYQVIETKTVDLAASFGALKTELVDKRRVLDIDLRVGDYDFDNTHIIRGQSFSFGSPRSTVELPIDDDPEALRRAIWLATDKAYKSATERYEKVVANKAVKVEEEDDSPDLSKETPEKFVGPERTYDIDVEEWKSKLKNLSGIFSEREFIYYGSANLDAEIVKKTIVTTEGSRLSFYEPRVKVFLSAKTKADDGMTLPLYESFFAFDPDDLPTEPQMASAAKDIVAKLEALREAPLMETYTGPAILSGEAAGVFFHEIFGHRVEGHRLKDPNDAQTFKDKVGEEVIAAILSVYFDPTKKELAGTKLAGYYEFDDEGVKAQKVTAVEDGKFQKFLMSRSPIEDFPHSNGHGRKQAGYKAVSRQSNLIVEAVDPVSDEELRKALIEECEKQGKEYGLYFEKVQGGFTFTGRSIPNSFNVNPLLVYKIYVDGRPDEIVRGVDLIGTPLTTFSNIVAASDDYGVFNGTCGAESGGVPVSACSPSLLSTKIEIQKKKKSQAKPPLLPAPSTVEAQ